MNNLQMWNRLVGTKPTVGRVEALLGSCLAGVYDHAPNFLYAQPNLLFRLPIGQTRHIEAPVISMSLILKASYLSARARVSPTDLPGLSIFGMPLEGSATAAARALESKNLFALDFVTEKSRWLIYCGKAVALEFNALPQPEPLSPDCSELVAVSYYFNVPYSGTNTPTIEVRPALPKI